MNSTTILTLHDTTSQFAEDLLGALAQAGFTVVTASPEDIKVSFACLLRNVGTIIVDYPRAVLEESVKTFNMCHKGVPILWLTDTIEVDCLETIEGTDIICIRLPLHPDILLRVVNWLTKSFSAYQQIVRVGMSVDAYRANSAGGTYGN